MIDTIGRGGPISRPPVAAAGQAPRPAALPAAAASRDSVGNAGQLVRTMAAQPPVDSARIEALRAAIAAGSYKPDPDAIAARMIALEAGSTGR